MNRRTKTHRQSGNALVALLVFMVIAMSVVALSAALLTDILDRELSSQSAQVALQIAESGAENAILRLLRDPAYTGETFSVGSGQAVVSVIGGMPMSITSRGENGEYARTVTVQLSRVNGSLQVDTWQESGN